MEITLPSTSADILNSSWADYEPYFQELVQRPIDQNNINKWLTDWSSLIDIISEMYARLNVAVTLDTLDEEAEAQFNAFLENVYPSAQSAEQQLKEKLLASGLKPDNFEVPLRKMRVDASIFRKQNLPLLVEARKLGSEYNKIIGAQTVQWQGEELTIQGMRPIMQTADRPLREKLWRMSYDRQLADRQQINDLWENEMRVRTQLAENTDLPDYRSYRWREMTRLDYTPQDCLEFQQAIELQAVPAATRLYEKYRLRAGADSLRPWDLDLELFPIGPSPLASYGDVDDLARTSEIIFNQVNPQLGEYFHLMREEELLDLANVKGKAPGAYCTNFPVSKRPFIFMNAVGLATDVRTILHESGHAFHNFERTRLPYAQQRNPGLEFAEVASMSMELLASPYLAADQGGFYDPAEAARFRIEHLERILAFWPYMAVVDAFQHWVYTHAKMGSKPSSCDAKWYELWMRFLPGVDWSGLEAEAMTGWHRKQHIHRAPFYYIEYGLAQLGAVQIWHGALEDQEAAVARYRYALSLGGTATLPDLYRTAGAKFAFDATTLGNAIKLVEETIAELEN